MRGGRECGETWRIKEKQRNLSLETRLSTGPAAR
jgi:hypothetical protein